MRSLKLGKLVEDGETSCLSIVASFFAIGFAIPGLIGIVQFIWMIFWRGFPAALSWAKTEEYFLISLMILLASLIVIALDLMISAKIKRSTKASHERALDKMSRDIRAEALSEMSQNLSDTKKIKFYEIANKRYRDQEGPDFKDFEPDLGAGNTR